MSEEKNMVVFEPTEDILKRLGTEAVFGKPIRQGDLLIVPVAEVQLGFGYGMGTSKEEVPSAAGAGGGGKARPVGFLKIRGEEVVFEPIVDTSRLSMAGMLLAGWSIFWLARSILGLLRPASGKGAPEEETEL